jgi:hypothetical protein
VTALVQPEGSDVFLEWGSIEVKPATAGTGETAALDLDLRGPSGVVLRLPDDDGPADNAVQFVVRPNLGRSKFCNSAPRTRRSHAPSRLPPRSSFTLPAECRRTFPRSISW